jgi:hypothetical protein
MAGNKAINQLPNAANRTDDDWFYIVRSGADRKLQAINMAPQVLAQQTLIDAADVLTLNATPIVVVPAAPAGYAIAPRGGVVQFSGGSVNYATNTTLMLISSTATGSAVRVASIVNRSLPNAFITPATSSPSPCIEGDSLSVQVLTGNPTAGDSDLTITIWYELHSV